MRSATVFDVCGQLEHRMTLVHHFCSFDNAVLVHDPCTVKHNDQLDSDILHAFNSQLKSGQLKTNNRGISARSYVGVSVGETTRQQSNTQGHEEAGRI